MLKFKENGEINRLTKQWFYQPECQSFNKNNQTFGLEYFGGLVVVFAVSLLVCLGILAIEHVYSCNINSKNVPETKSEPSEDAKFLETNV